MTDAYISTDAYAREAARRALQEALDRRDNGGPVCAEVPTFPDVRPLAATPSAGDDTGYDVAAVA